MEKYALDAERYKSIVDYFNEFPTTVSVNKSYLEDLRDSLKNAFLEVKKSNTTDIQKKIYLKGEFKRLEKKVHSLLVKDLREKLQSIEVSREKRESIIDQWIGELI